MLHSLGLLIFQEIGFDIIPAWKSSGILLIAIVLLMGLELLALVWVLFIRKPNRRSANRP